MIERIKAATDWPRDKVEYAKFIIDLVAKEHKIINYDSLYGKARQSGVVWPRQEIMYLLRKYIKGSTTTAIGRILGRDHATVLHACKAIEARIETEKPFRLYMKDLESQIKIVQPDNYSSEGNFAKQHLFLLKREELFLFYGQGDFEHDFTTELQNLGQAIYNIKNDD